MRHTLVVEGALRSRAVRDAQAGGMRHTVVAEAGAQDTRLGRALEVAVGHIR